MFMRFKTLMKSASTLASARIWRSGSTNTIKLASDLRSQTARGRWLQFKLSKAVTVLVGSNINLRNHAAREDAGCAIMLLHLIDLYRATRRREGSSRESKKDYLHFLYIARGSLSETQYFIHLARRLKYLSATDADLLHQQTKLAFGCLHGLVQAVEKEAGKLSKLVATITSLLVIGVAHWSRGQLSVVT